VITSGNNDTSKSTSWKVLETVMSHLNSDNIFLTRALHIVEDVCYDYKTKARISIISRLYSNFLCALKILIDLSFLISDKMQSSGCQVNYLAAFCKRKMLYHRF